MQKIMKTVHGSHLYGLSTENSDTDYKGIYLPTLEELLLNTYKPIINLDSNKNGKNDSTDVDMEWIALPTFIQMACKGEAIALDMLHTNQAELDNEYGWIWKTIIQNKDKFYTKYLKAYTGFLKGIVSKNSNTEHKLKVIKNLVHMLSSFPNDIRLHSIWNSLPTDGKHLIKTTVDSKNLSRFWSVFGSKYGENVTADYCAKMLSHKYINADKEQTEYNWKSISHALRLGYQMIDIHTKGFFEYPLDETNFILRVKNGELDYETVVEPELKRVLDEIDDLIKKSNLPERVDKEYWDAFLLRVYNDSYTLGEFW